jgi:hypothetical protein
VSSGGGTELVVLATCGTWAHLHEIFGVFTAVTTKNAVFWDVRPYGSSKS